MTATPTIFHVEPLDEIEEVPDEVPSEVIDVAGLAWFEAVADGVGWAVMDPVPADVAIVKDAEVLAFDDVCSIVSNAENMLNALPSVLEAAREGRMSAETCSGVPSSPVPVS